MPSTNKAYIGVLLVLSFLLAFAYRTYTGDIDLTASGIGIILVTTLAFAIGIFVLLWIIKRLS